MMNEHFKLLNGHVLLSKEYILKDDLKYWGGANLLTISGFRLPMCASVIYDLKGKGSRAHPIGGNPL